MKFVFGEQMTIDDFLGKTSIPRNDGNKWLIDILGEDYHGSEIILDSFVKANSIINDPKYKKIMCSISGGADSSIMLDLLWRIDREKKIDYIWIDTGLEYQAMKDHLVQLEERYGITINRTNAVRPIPLAINSTGQPFISKYVSDMIHRLQRNNFDWSNDTFENHYKKYPNCKQGLKWWDDQYDGGTHSSFNICRHRMLREFMIENPPWFPISQSCCKYVKKDSLHKIYKNGAYDLSCYGVRAREGGIRATAYKDGCFSQKTYAGTTEYRPLFWYTDDDIKEYENRFGIVQSKAYTLYGLKRTGCVACTFGRDFEFELQVAKEYEPKLYKAACNIFKDAQEYTRMYHQYRNAH